MQKKYLCIFIGIGIVLMCAVFLMWAKKIQPAPQQNAQTTQSSPDNQAASSVQEESQASTEPITYPQHIVVIPHSDQVWYEIPEFGVRMKLKRAFAEDLIYEVADNENSVHNSEWNFAYLSTKTLTALNSSCSPEQWGIGSIIDKHKLLTRTEMENKSPLDYFIWAPSQDVCWWVNGYGEKYEEIAENYTLLGSKAISDGMKTLQWIPKK